MAEIKFDNLYDQLGLLDQKFYDSTFKNTYDPNKSQPMLEGKKGYDQMKAVYEAEQQVPESSFLSMLNPFSSASAAEVTPGTYKPNNSLQQKVDVMNQFDLPFNYSADDLQARARRAMTQPGLSIQLEKNNPNIPDEIEFLDGQKFTATRYDPYNDPSLNRATTTSNEPMDIEDFLGISTPQNLGFIEDAPQVKEAIYQDRIMNPNLPGFAYQPKESLRNIIGSQLQNAKTKAGQGFDFAKQIPGMVLSAATGIPFAGQIAQGIGGLLGSIFKESPEQKNFRENIATDPEYQNLVNSIPGMSNYNQIFGMGSGRGLMGAIDKRLATLARTEKRQGVNFSETLKERRKKLEALRELERQKEAEFLESQRRGRRPGTGGDGGGGTQDSGGPTGGFSYDSGGRQGYGYGLKYGGRVGYANGGLASLFTRRG